MDPLCNRCGRCCHYQKGGVWKKCKNLVVHTTGSRILTSCRIWNDPGRVGTEIDKGVFCNNVQDLKQNYVGCPYNQPGQREVLVQIRPYHD